jgi:hypothetical protein
VASAKIRQERILTTEEKDLERGEDDNYAASFG